jgi:hypothetical protein
MDTSVRKLAESLADPNYERCARSSARPMAAITFDPPSQFPTAAVFQIN